MRCEAGYVVIDRFHQGGCAVQPAKRIVISEESWPYFSPFEHPPLRAELGMKQATSPWDCSMAPEQSWDVLTTPKRVKLQDELKIRRYLPRGTVPRGTAPATPRKRKATTTPVTPPSTPHKRRKHNKCVVLFFV